MNEEARRIYMRAYQNVWIKERRRQYLEGKSCKVCGESDWTKLVIHHRDPEQKEDHRIWTWTAVRRLAELAKCDILCGHCHQMHHNPPNPLVHGTRNAYFKKGCRCADCVQWRRDYERELYARRRAIPVYWPVRVEMVGE